MERTEKLLKAFLAAGESGKHGVTPTQCEVSINHARSNSIPNAQPCPVSASFHEVALCSNFFRPYDGNNAVNPTGTFSSLTGIFSGIARSKLRSKLTLFCCAPKKIKNAPKEGARCGRANVGKAHSPRLGPPCLCGVRLVAVIPLQTFASLRTDIACRPIIVHLFGSDSSQKR